MTTVKETYLSEVPIYGQAPENTEVAIYFDSTEHGWVIQHFHKNYWLWIADTNEEAIELCNQMKWKLNE